MLWNFGAYKRFLLVTVQTTPLLIGERDIGFHGSMREPSFPYPWGEIDHVFRRMDAHPLHKWLRNGFQIQVNMKQLHQDMD